mgnify:CR=1 FL=1
MRVLLFSVIIFIIDQVSKFLIKGINIPFLGISIQGMRPGSSISLIDNFFRFTFIENPGMAFGLEIGSKPIRAVFTIIASIFIMYFIYKNRNEIFYLRFALALILGGALGNLVDRIFYGVIYGTGSLLHGNVVDFLQVNIPDIKIFGKVFYSWPIFNVADISVTAGFVMILIGYRKIFNNKEVEEQKPIDSQILNTESSEKIPLHTSETGNIINKIENKTND